MHIIDGETGTCGLRFRAELNERHNIRNSHGENFVFGEPRLLMFEAPEKYNDLFHPNGKSVACGHRYDTGDGRQVHDRLDLRKTDLSVENFSPNGALVLAVPFIHPNQKSEYPIMHWSVKSIDQIDFDPPAEMIKMLCWNLIMRALMKLQKSPPKSIERLKILGRGVCIRSWNIYWMK